MHKSRTIQCIWQLGCHTFRIWTHEASLACCTVDSTRLAVLSLVAENWAAGGGGAIGTLWADGAADLVAIGVVTWITWHTATGAETTLM